MNAENENIFGNRLKQARKMAGLSLQEVADRLQNEITKQALSKYELGSMKPSNDVLLALSRSLNVKPDFFFKIQMVELGEILFRKKQSLSKRDEEIIVEQARDYVERFLELESIMGVVNQFINPIKHLPINGRKDIELASLKLRSDWDLGNGPINNVVEMLELRGIKVVLIDAVEALDGFAAFAANGVPIVMINSREKSSERTRFTIIHELAHLLLQFAQELLLDNKQIEKLCHYFSSCFLLPEAMLINLIGGLKRTHIQIRELINIKETFGISLRAIIHRLKELSVITQVYYEKWMVYLTKNFGAKGEPGNYGIVEKPMLFEQLIDRGLSEGQISISKAAALCNISVNEIRKGFFSVS